MARIYRLGKRAVQTGQTRDRLLDAACARIEAHGYHGLSLEDVAHEAGVTRATVYNQFGGKLGVLDAVLARVTSKDAAARLGDAAKAPDAGEALAALVDETCRFWQAHRGLFRRLLGLASVDPETRPTVEARERWRRAGVARVVGALAAQGRLREGWTTPGATASVLALTAFATWDQLANSSGVTARDVPALMHRMLDALLAPR